MENLVVLTGIAVVLVAAFFALQEKFGAPGEGELEKAKYQYARKKFFMSRAEHEFYDVLTNAVGGQYFIFAQVHLPTLLDEKVKGQNWHAAFRHIDEKSVDFVLCDKAYISPVLAIELDDRSHDAQDRIVRDGEVERIFKAAGLPLLRIKNNGVFDAGDLTAKISSALSK